MNSFFVPQLGGQIYAMSGMVTRLNLLADHAGTYRGISSNFSGDGFSDMHFEVDAVSAPQFEHWATAAHNSGPGLDAQSYADLAKPSKDVAPFTYRSVAPGLFGGIVSAELTDPSLCLPSASLRAER
jgi:cytochrome o ubiquinol oxidase subunit 2